MASVTGQLCRSADLGSELALDALSAAALPPSAQFRIIPEGAVHDCWPWLERIQLDRDREAGSDFLNVFFRDSRVATNAPNPSARRSGLRFLNRLGYLGCINSDERDPRVTSRMVCSGW